MSLRSKVTPTEKPRRVFCPGPCPFSYRQITDLCSETGSSKWVCGSKVTPTEKPRRSSAPGPCPFIYKLLIFALKLVLPSESVRWLRRRNPDVLLPLVLAHSATNYWSLLWNWFFHVSLLSTVTPTETPRCLLPLVLVHSATDKLLIFALELVLPSESAGPRWHRRRNSDVLLPLVLVHSATDKLLIFALKLVLPSESAGPRWHRRRNSDVLLPLVLVHSATDKLLIFALELVLPSESALHGDTDRDTQVSSAPGSCPFRHRLIALYCRLKGLKVVQFASWVELGQGRRGRGGKMQYPDSSFFALNVPATATSQTAFTKWAKISSAPFIKSWSLSLWIVYFNMNHIEAAPLTHCFPVSHVCLKVSAWSETDTTRRTDVG